MRRQPLLVIEHCENHLSRWILYEYENASRIWGKERLVFTNVRRREWCEKLAKLGTCIEESVVELEGRLYSSKEKVLVLDPQAKRKLEPRDLDDVEVIVIGGILGDHPPRGRTNLYITSKLPGCRARNIGPYQFSIDGSVYIVKQVLSSKRLEDIPVVVRPRFRFKDVYGIEVEIELPFAYPLVEGKPLIHEGVIRLLKSGLTFYEAMRS